jgi:hypothetical protein
MASFVTQEELENMIGRAKVIDLFDDDRDGALDAAELARLNGIIAEANDHTTGVLIKKGWENDQLDDISADRAVRRAACQLAAAYAGERKPEFADANGDFPFNAQGKRGKEYLRDFVKGEQRSRTEAQAGNNKSIGGRVSISTPSSVFGRDPNDPDDQYGDGRGF